jgi:hypothetical protein
MQFFPIIRQLSLCAILLTSMALSCQDHNIPDPPTNCQRMDGTSRAVNCEFEFVSAEFSRPSDGFVYGTVTSQNPNLTIPDPPDGFIVGSASSKFAIPLNVKVILKRISPSPSPSSQYIIRNDVETNFPWDPSGNREGFSRIGGGYPLSPDDEQTPQTINVPVGGTYSYQARTSLAGLYIINNNTIIYPLNTYWLLIQNVDTSKKLRNAPYNYSLYRDVAEARLQFIPRVN